MDGEWCRCPICFEDYSSIHRPTTFTCGHSTCIDHTTGVRRLQNCPICRQLLRQGDVYHVSYNLEEASRLFQAIKRAIDWSTVKLPPAPIGNLVQRGAVEMIDSDEIYARQLQADFNREITHQPPRREQVRIEGPRSCIEEMIRRLPTVPVTVRPTSHEKLCGHRCDLDSTNRCCTCSDKRPHLANNSYESYVDGHGIRNCAARNEYYCPTCKSR